MVAVGFTEYIEFKLVFIAGDVHIFIELNWYQLKSIQINSLLSLIIVDYIRIKISKSYRLF